MDRRRVEAQKHTSKFLRLLGGQNSSSIFPDSPFFVLNGTRSYVARTYISDTLLPTNKCNDDLPNNGLEILGIW